MSMFGDSSAMTVVIKARNEAGKVFDGINKNMTKFKSSAEKMQSSFTKMSVLGTAAFGAVSLGASKAISKARDFEEETNKFGVVFQDVSREAENMAATLNDNYGLSILKSKQLLSSTGDILTGFGFAGQAALDMSGDVNTLAVDLASFTNAQGGAEAVSKALTAALLGERESLKTYGIAIMEADVEAELLAKGMSGLTGEALRQAKAQATLDIAYRQSKNAVGDYERSAGSLTQTQTEVTKTVEDLQIKLGQTLSPMLNVVLKSVLPVIEALKNWVSAHPALTRVIIIGTAAMGGLLAVIGLIGLALPALITGFTLLTSPISLTIIAVGLLAFAGYELIKNWDKVVSTFIKLIKGLGKVMIAFIKDAINNFKNLGKNLFNVFKAIGQALTGNIEGAKETLKNTISGMLSNTLGQFGEMSTTFSDWGQGIKDKLVETASGIKDKLSTVYGETNITTKASVEENKNIISTLPAATSSAMTAMAEESKEKTAEIISYIEDVSNAFDGVKESFKKLEDLNSESVRANVDINSEFAEAFVEQEKKVADLQAQANKESDVDIKASLLERLEYEKAELAKYHTLEIAFAKEIDDVRRINSLSDIARTVETLNAKRTALNEEMETNRNIILKEVQMNQGKFNDLLEMQSIFAIDAFDITKKLTDDKIAQYDREINKLQELSNKLAKVSGSNSISLSLGTSSYQHGGIIPGSPTQAVPIIAHGGETVIPANSNSAGGGGSTVININNPSVRNDGDLRQMKTMVEEVFRDIFLNNKVNV